MKPSDVKKFIPLAIGLAIFAYAGGKIGWDKVFAIISIADLQKVALVIALVTLVVAIKSAREWLVLQKISKTQFNGIKPAQIFTVGVFANEFFPAGTGELLRAYIIKKIASVGFGKPLAPLLIERTFDTFFLLAVGLLGAHYLFSSQVYAASASLFLVVLLTAFFFASIFKARFSLKLATFAAHAIEKTVGAIGLLEKYAKLAAKKIREMGASFEESRAVYAKDWKILAGAFLLTALAWMVEALIQQTVFSSIGYEIDYFQMFAITALSILIGVFSFIPGGIGARDGAYAFLITLAIPGTSLEVGFAASLLYRAIIYLWLGPFAAYSAWKLRILVKDAKKIA